jgi:hypothetical protein
LPEIFWFVVFALICGPLFCFSPRFRGEIPNLLSRLSPWQVIFDARVFAAIGIYWPARCAKSQKAKSPELLPK